MSFIGGPISVMTSSKAGGQVKYVMDQIITGAGADLG
jgi:hypothetical protein